MQLLQGLLGGPAAASGSEPRAPPSARPRLSPAPLRYLRRQWGHVLQMAGEGHHLVHEGLQHVLCQPRLGAQVPEKRLGARGTGVFQPYTAPPQNLPSESRAWLLTGAFRVKGQPVPRKKLWRGYLAPF